MSNGSQLAQLRAMNNALSRRKRYLALSFVSFSLYACSAPKDTDEEKRSPPKIKPVSPDVVLKRLDAKIALDAWVPLTSKTNPALARKLGKVRLDQANSLGIWAGRQAVSSPCNNVQRIKLSEKATRKQLAWDVTCEGTLGVAISEKSALQMQHEVDPIRYPLRGDDLPDMFARPQSGAADKIATLINLNQHLCAKVLDVKSLAVRQNVYEVTCVEYRGGSGTVRYLVDANSGLATPL